MRLIIALILLSFCHNQILAQDTSSAFNKIKIGIYANWKEFNNNSPSINYPFLVVPHYTQRKKDSTSIDSVFDGYYCNFNDKLVILKKPFGLYDGSHLYVSYERKKDTVLFLRSEYVGRYPFVSINYKEGFYGGGIGPIGLLSLIVGVADGALSSPKKTIFYYNKNGQIIQATAQSIGFLIRKEKDFEKEYDLEKKINIDTFEKYLIKMNQRYPL